MRDLTDNGVPFSIEFLAHNQSTQSSGGVRVVNSCVLRPGYNAQQSELSEVLIHYKDLDTDRYGIFYAPLLLKFNNVLICRIDL